MTKGTVESIAKKSIVVTVGSEAKTLTGKSVEALAGDLKLGDTVEFEESQGAITVRKAKKTAGAAPTERRSSSSPAPAKQQIYY